MGSRPSQPGPVSQPAATGPGASLNTAEAARHVHRAPATMRWLRHVGRGPRWTRGPGGRAVYTIEDLAAWLAGEPTEDAAVLARVRGLLELTTPGIDPATDAARHVAATEKKG